MGFVWDLQLCSAWDMGYEGDMGYGTNFPAYRDGISKNVWGIREYGFQGVWVRRESTVLSYGYDIHWQTNQFLIRQRNPHQLYNGVFIDAQ